MTEILRLADNNRCYPVGKTWTQHWPLMTEDDHWSEQLRLLRGATWRFELQAPDGKILASYKSHRGLEKRINADEEALRDNLPYNCIQWAATFEDGSGWHGSLSLEDWCKLAWGLRSVHDDENQIVNWLWIKVKERADPGE